MTEPRPDAPTEHDVAVLAEQLGRPPRGVVGIAARCVCGPPLVVPTSEPLERERSTDTRLLRQRAVGGPALEVGIELGQGARRIAGVPR